MAVLAFISVTTAVLLAEYLMRQKTDEDQKAARKALAQVLNDDGNEDKDKDLMEYAQEDQMFDVPLNDDHVGYVGPDMHSDMIGNDGDHDSTTEKYYEPSQTRISDMVNQGYEDEYTFDVEL